MVNIIIQWLLAIIAVEAIVEILVDSDLFFELRNYLSKKANNAEKDLKTRYRKIKAFILKKVAQLWTCGYCMSVWISAIFSWALIGPIDNNNINYRVIDFIIKLFFLHRMSNLFHELASRWFKRLPTVVVTTSTTPIVEDVSADVEEAIPVGEFEEEPNAADIKRFNEHQTL